MAVKEQVLYFTLKSINEAILWVRGALPQQGLLY